MLAHDRMPIEAITIISINGEMVAKSNVAAKQRDTLNDYPIDGIDNIKGDIGGVTYAADGR